MTTSEKPPANPPATLNLASLLTMLAADEGLRPTPRKFGAPDLFPGVLPPEGSRPASYMALDSQAFQSVYSYLNRGNGLICGLGFPGYQYLAELSQRSEYRAPAETLATEMTRRWLEVVGDNEGDHSQRIKELTQDINDFGLREHCDALVKMDSFFGRGQLAINIKGQEKKTQQPLLLTPQTVRKGSLLGFRTVEPMWTSPLAWNSTDPSRPDFYKPTSWFVLAQEWHATRLLTFIARELPDMLKPAYNFSGMSMSQLIEPYVQRWLKTVDSVNRLLSNFSKLGLRTNMQAALAGDATEAGNVFKRIQLYTQAADNRGVLVMDKNSEEMFLLNTPLSGLHELQAQAQEHMSAPTHIPLVKLFGITPTGLNASSEGEIKVYYDWVSASQASFLGQHLSTLLDLLQLNRYGNIDQGIRLRWVQLDQPTDTELAQIRKSDADAAAVYITNGVITPDEQRQALQSDPNSGYDNLTGKAPPPPTQTDAEHEHGLGEESKDKDHERGEESAEKAHERAKELATIDAKGKGE